MHRFPDMYKRFRCTLSYLNWVFVFMASVNYISRCNGSTLNCVTLRELMGNNTMNAL